MREGREGGGRARRRPHLPLDVKFHRSSLRPGPRKLMARASAAMPTTPSLGTCGEVNSAAMAPIPKLSADETER
jgi:hypothetical protein